MKSQRKIVVNDIYPAIAGEGINAGHPVTLIRLFGSNIEDKLDPHPYATSAQTKGENARSLLIDDVLEEVNKLKGNKKHLLIAGGEPLLQQDALIELLTRYATWFNKKPYVEIETNGTIEPKAELDALVDKYNVGVRLANSTMHKDTRNTFDTRVKNASGKFFVDSKKASFKFYLENATEIKEVEEVQTILQIPQHKIWLTFAPTNPIDVKQTAAPIAKLCLQKGYKFSPRLHVTVFGAKRGF